MTTTEAQSLASGDEVRRGYFIGIVMEATPKSVAIFWEYQKMYETTTYNKGNAELRGIAITRKAPQKTTSDRGRVDLNLERSAGLHARGISPRGQGFLDVIST